MKKIVKPCLLKQKFMLQHLINSFTNHLVITIGLKKAIFYLYQQILMVMNKMVNQWLV
uniref:Uncharacterized protein n=1 Tax=uncultured marine virus TaxID=186617 RepID=A0A0F7LAU2_9VIRU|nr:hypothetical protein [uncultured marine virus]